MGLAARFPSQRKSYSHITWNLSDVTLQKKKKNNNKNLRLRRGYKPQNKTAVAPATYNLARQLRRKTGPTVQIRHCPFSSASPFSVFTTAPQRKQPSPNFRCFFEQYVGQSSCLQIYAFSLYVKENLPWAKQKKKWTELCFLAFSSHCSESAHQNEKKEKKVVQDTTWKFLLIFFIPGLIQSKVNEKPRLGAPPGVLRKGSFPLFLLLLLLPVAFEPIWR